MENTEAADALREADRLSARARSAGRWYVRYLTFFAIASFVLALCFGLVGPKWGAWVITPLWLAFVIVISVYANRQRAVPRGMARIHNVMIVAWAVLWALVLFGSFVLQQPLWWWLLGGLALATPALVARRAVQQLLEP
jgi:uncharacterized membrane protein YjjP (DUF1212 family)